MHVPSVVDSLSTTLRVGERAGRARRPAGLSAAGWRDRGGRRAGPKTREKRGSRCVRQPRIFDRRCPEDEDVVCRRHMIALSRRKRFELVKFVRRGFHRFYWLPFLLGGRVLLVALWPFPKAVPTPSCRRALQLAGALLSPSELLPRRGPRNLPCLPSPRAPRGLCVFFQLSAGGLTS